MHRGLPDDARRRSQQRLGPLPRSPGRRRDRGRRPVPTSRRPDGSRRSSDTKGEHAHDRSHRRAVEEWLEARLELLEGGEGAHPPQRRPRPAAAGAALGAHRQGLPLRHRGRRGHARRPVPRPFAAARLPLHVRARLGRRAARAARRSPTASTRRTSISRTTTSRSPRSPGPRSRSCSRYREPDGMELPVGVVGPERLQLRLQRLVHRGVGRARWLVQLPAARRLAARSREPAVRGSRA